jgi:hypothetical protein
VKELCSRDYFKFFEHFYRLDLLAALKPERLCQIDENKQKFFLQELQNFTVYEIAEINRTCKSSSEGFELSLADELPDLDKMSKNRRILTRS